MENGNPVIFHLEMFVLRFVSLHMWCYDGCCSGVYEVAVSDAYLFLSRSRKSSLIYFSIIIVLLASCLDGFDQLSVSFASDSREASFYQSSYPS